MSQVVDYKCPNCGGVLLFDPAARGLTCPNCHSQYQVPVGDAAQFASRTALGGPVDPLATGSTGAPIDAATAAAQAAARAAAAQTAAADPSGASDRTGLGLVQCNSCGAQIVVESATQASTECLYCHSPVVIVGQLAGGLQPDTVVPFVVNRDQAMELFKTWISKKRYLQTGFYSADRIDKLTGIYFPYFAVDAIIQGHVEGTAHFTTRSNDRTIDHNYHVQLDGTVDVGNLPQEALRANRGNKLMNRLLPWDLRYQVPFTPQYLSGFQTERRDVDFVDVQDEVAYFLDLAARRTFASQVFNDDSRYTDIKLWSTSQIQSWQNRYTLLPAWVLFYIAPDGQTYFYGVNGQTGETAGKLPINRRKLVIHSVLLSVGGLVIAIAGIIAGVFS